MASKNTALTASQIRDFEQNPVWNEIAARISNLAIVSRDKAIDASDPREAGKCRAYELVLELSNSLLIESEEGKGMVSKIIRLTR